MRKSICILLLSAGCAALARVDPMNAQAAQTAASEAESRTMSPNQALARLAKDIMIRSLPPEYEKRDGWGRQSEITAGFEWVRKGRRWELEKRKKMVNDGLWRMYRVKLLDPERQLHVWFSKPKPAPDGATALQIVLRAKLWTEARQERWRSGIKGLNLHIEAESIVEVRLDVEVAVQAVEGSWGTIAIRPKVNDVKLTLVDLTVRRISKIGGDLAKELGNATEGILSDELRKRERETARKLNQELYDNREKLEFSPAQIAEFGWDKVRALLGADVE